MLECKALHLQVDRLQDGILTGDLLYAAPCCVLHDFFMDFKNLKFLELFLSPEM